MSEIIIENSALAPLIVTMYEQKHLKVQTAPPAQQAPPSSPRGMINTNVPRFSNPFGQGFTHQTDKF